MTWVYAQASGGLWRAGVLIATGYAGHGAGLDNPADAADVGLGPLPVGGYTIGPPFDHPICGPYCLRLTPDASNDMDGRDGFLIHGDNFALNHTASDGCIILARPVREEIAQSGDTRLAVVADDRAAQAVSVPNSQPEGA